MVSYCDRWMSVKHCQQLLQKTSPPKLLAGFGPDFAGMIPYIALLKNCSDGSGSCISRSHRLKVDFQDENFKKNLLV